MCSAVPRRIVLRSHALNSTLAPQREEGQPEGCSTVATLNVATPPARTQPMCRSTPARRVRRCGNARRVDPPTEGHAGERR